MPGVKKKEIRGPQIFTLCSEGRQCLDLGPGFQCILKEKSVSCQSHLELSLFENTVHHSGEGMAAGAEDAHCISTDQEAQQNRK